jgi:DNA-binding transcriptional ArsR family regulator
MARKMKKREAAEALRGKLRQVIDPALAKALSHPLRSHILVTLGDRIASPNEIARELGLAARDLDYHVKVLLEMGMIQLVRREKRRGAREHFYELSSSLVYLDDPTWSGVPSQIRSSFSANLLRMVTEEAMDALKAGTFSARDSHQSRTPMLLDEQGWNELISVMAGALEQVMAVQRKSERRRRQGAEIAIPVEVFMIGFETATGRRQGPAISAG